ncbi:hypothetical protein V2J09_019155 [Rumex salicifolius]
MLNFQWPNWVLGVKWPGTIASCYNMERLNCDARLMLVSDLDCTMVDHDDADNSSLLKFNSLWEAFYRPNSLLVFSTGRSPASYKELRKEKPLFTPDIAVMSVGTEIAYGYSLSTDQEWENLLNHKWNRSTVLEETSKFPELVPQSEVDQRPHKVSFFIDKVRALKVISVLQERLEQRGLDIKIIYSGGIALDVLPRGAGKGQALAYLMKKFEVIGKVPANTLVCGDSGNDAELFTVPGVYGVMVSNAQEELLEWRAQNAMNNENIIHATRRCAAGIVEAMDQFRLGPSIPLRETTELLESKATNPGYEVVKFYLLYEQWRRAEVQKPEILMKLMKSNFHPTGTFVHLNAVEKPLHDCLDALEKCYGDKKGQSFSVWLDKVTFTQISSDSWKVTFDKWELTEIDNFSLKLCIRRNSCWLLNYGFTDIKGTRWIHVDACTTKLFKWINRQGTL